MSTLPTISVVIPCYNAARYIAATLRSVLAQDWPELQVIVVDDGSSDGSADLVQREFPGVTVLRQSNQGVAAARNLGISQTHGEWIAFVDADDIWLPGKLHVQWALMQANPEARMCYTAWHVWPSVDPAPSAAELAGLAASSGDAAQWTGPSGWIYPDLLMDCCVWTSTVLMQRSLLEEIGSFDPSLRIGEDYDLWLRASRVTPILRVPAPYALYRMHPASITRSVPDKNYRSLVIEQALQRWGYESPDGRVARKPEVQAMLARTWAEHAATHLRAGSTQQARQACAQALRRDLCCRSAWKVLLKAGARNCMSM